MSSSDSSCPVVYNVEQAVGRLGTNTRGDVILVEYLLNGIYPAATKELNCAGQCTPATIRWINQFQTDAKRSGKNVPIDGRVDRAFGTPATITRAPYTIVFMNLKLKAANPTAFQRIPQVVPLSTPAPLPQVPKTGQPSAPSSPGGSHAPGSPPGPITMPMRSWTKNGTLFMVSTNGSAIVSYPSGEPPFLGQAYPILGGKYRLIHRHGTEIW
jgi:hypothetical protein